MLNFQTPIWTLIRQLFSGLIIAVSISACSTDHGAEAADSPRQTYLKFTDLLSAEQYSDAFNFLDDNAKSDLRLTLTVIAGVIGAPTSKVETMSDFEIFVVFMKNRNPFMIEHISENIVEDIAILDIQVFTEGKSITNQIRMKRYFDEWKINTTGTAFHEK